MILFWECDQIGFCVFYSRKTLFTTWYIPSTSFTVIGITHIWLGIFLTILFTIGYVGGVTRKGPQWPALLLVRHRLFRFVFIFFFNFIFLCHTPRACPSFGMTTTQDIRDLFLRDAAHMSVWVQNQTERLLFTFIQGDTEVFYLLNSQTTSPNTLNSVTGSGHVKYKKNPLQFDFTKVLSVCFPIEESTWCFNC